LREVVYYRKYAQQPLTTGPTYLSCVTLSTL
jgi:hypothetical protein